MGGCLFEQCIEILAIVALGNDSQLLATTGQQSRQVHFAVLDKRRQQLPIDAPHCQAIADGPKDRDGKRHPAGAFLAPVQRRIAREGGLVEHLQAASTIDPHQRVLVLRHTSDQQRQQLIDDTLALFRTFENH
ncbi:hypothetical protein D3C84_860770 [compost metagenome]